MTFRNVARSAQTQHTEVPCLNKPQAQGDLLMVPTIAPPDCTWTEVPLAGLQVIKSDLTGHAHTLLPSASGTRWAAARVSGTIIGYVYIPADQTALLVHSEEHTPSGLAAGCYALHRKREADLVGKRQQAIYNPLYADWEDERFSLLED